MKKKFKEPEMEIILFAKNDVLMCSSGEGDDDEGAIDLNTNR